LRMLVVFGPHSSVQVIGAVHPKHLTSLRFSGFGPHAQSVKTVYRRGGPKSAATAS
jgi:hypothetical protein